MAKANFGDVNISYTTSPEEQVYINETKQKPYFTWGEQAKANYDASAVNMKGFDVTAKAFLGVEGSWLDGRSEKYDNILTPEEANEKFSTNFGFSANVREADAAIAAKRYKLQREYAIYADANNSYTSATLAGGIAGYVVDNPIEMGVTMALTLASMGSYGAVAAPTMIGRVLQMGMTAQKMSVAAKATSFGTKMSGLLGFMAREAVTTAAIESGIQGMVGAMYGSSDALEGEYTAADFAHAVAAASLGNLLFTRMSYTGALKRAESVLAASAVEGNLIPKVLASSYETPIPASTRTMDKASKQAMYTQLFDPDGSYAAKQADLESTFTKIQRPQLEDYASKQTMYDDLFDATKTIEGQLDARYMARKLDIDHALSLVDVKGQELVPFKKSTGFYIQPKPLDMRRVTSHMGYGDGATMMLVDTYGSTNKKAFKETLEVMEERGFRFEGMTHANLTRSHKLFNLDQPLTKEWAKEMEDMLTDIYGKSDPAIGKWVREEGRTFKDVMNSGIVKMDNAKQIAKVRSVAKDLGYDGYISFKDKGKNFPEIHVFDKNGIVQKGANIKTTHKQINAIAKANTEFVAEGIEYATPELIEKNMKALNKELNSFKKLANEADAVVSDIGIDVKSLRETKRIADDTIERMTNEANDMLAYVKETDTMMTNIDKQIQKAISDITLDYDKVMKMKKQFTGCLGG